MELPELGHVRGKFHKRVWMETNDVVLLGLRATCDTSDTKADIIGKYNSDEVKTLKACGEIPKTIDLTNALATVIDKDAPSVNSNDIDIEGANFNFDDI